MNIPERMKHFNVPSVSYTRFYGLNVFVNEQFGVLEKGADRAADDNAIFHACSISKMITALCVLKLAQDGHLDLYKDVNEYLTEWKIADNEFVAEKKVTLANLLAHQAGFCDYDGSFSPYKKGDAVPKTIDILRGVTPYNPEEVRAKYVPETDCEYSDAGYCVISQVLQDVFGEDVPKIAKRLIFEPLGLQRTFFWEIGKEPPEGINLEDCAAGHDNDGEVVDEIRAQYPNIEGAGLWATPHEMAKIAVDLLKSYHGNGGIVLNQEMAKLMLTPYGCVNDIGLGVFLDKDKNGEPYFFSQGWGIGMQCKLRVYYDKQQGVVVMTNSEPGMEQDVALVGEIIESVFE
ncbi:MAG: beta-lactamase family protein [Defluviitaleaceae bacterium]|nr:beta-lactamase family protein [Defluviitaleaceae bacterium]